MFHSLLDSLCALGAFLTALVMSWRDIRTRLVTDSQLAWFGFFVILPRALASGSSPCPPFPPLWLKQVLALARTGSGALLLVAVALPARLVAGRELVGRGDILFALAAGFMLPAGRSVPMVSLAFFLALPFSLGILLAQKNRRPLPFIPFLTAAAFLIRWLPPADPFF